MVRKLILTLVLLTAVASAAPLPAYALMVYTSADSYSGGQTVSAQQTAVGTDDASSDIRTTMGGGSATIYIQTISNGQKHEETYTKQTSPAPSTTMGFVATTTLPSVLWLHTIFHWVPLKLHLPLFGRFFSWFK
jgi:hypothetical protein